MSWEIFLEKSNDDLKCAKILMEYERFETAAYLLQQSVEKRVKSIMMEIMPLTEPKPLGHQPNFFFTNEFIEMLKLQKDQSYYKIFNDIKEIFDWSKNSNGGFYITWKNSLGIELNEQESKIWSKREQKNNQIINKSQKLKEDNIKKRINQNTSTNIKPAEKKIPIEASEQIDNLFRFFLLYCICQDFTIKLLPHESLGRYPEKIDDNILSTDLYIKHSDQLYNLINEVENLFQVCDYCKSLDASALLNLLFICGSDHK